MALAMDDLPRRQKLRHRNGPTSARKPRCKTRTKRAFLSRQRRMRTTAAVPVDDLVPFCARRRQLRRSRARYEYHRCLLFRQHGKPEYSVNCSIWRTPLVSTSDPPKPQPGEGAYLSGRRVAYMATTTTEEAATATATTTTGAADRV